MRDPPYRFQILCSAALCKINREVYRGRIAAKLAFSRFGVGYAPTPERRWEKERQETENGRVGEAEGTTSECVRLWRGALCPGLWEALCVLQVPHDLSCRACERFLQSPFFGFSPVVETSPLVANQISTDKLSPGSTPHLPPISLTRESACVGGEARFPIPIFFCASSSSIIIYLVVFVAGQKPKSRFGGC